MARRTVLAIAVASVLALAGCATGDDPGSGAGSSTSSSSPPPGPRSGDCDVSAPLPPLPTWAAHGGEWGDFVQATPDHPRGTRGQGEGADPGLGLLVDHASGPSSAVDVQVRFALVSGQHPDGAGLVFHWDGPSYNIVRYSPSEAGWHLFTVIDGDRSKVDLPPVVPTPLGPGLCKWVTLRIVADGADVEAFQDGQRVLAATLPDGASMSGQAGLFVRGDSVALFDGYAIDGS